MRTGQEVYLSKIYYNPIHNHPKKKKRFQIFRPSLFCKGDWEVSDVLRRFVFAGAHDLLTVIRLVLWIISSPVCVPPMNK